MNDLMTSTESLPPEIDAGPVSEDVDKMVAEALKSIIGAKMREAENRVSLRYTVETRWLDDLRQYHGKYPDDVKANLTSNKKSAVFINQTRTKTNGLAARISDILFPTDDRNFGIQPTPVPELADQAKQAVEKALQMKATGQAVAANPQAPPEAVAEMDGKVEAAEAEAAQLQAIIDEARKRAEAMQTEIEDVLTECGYQGQMRTVIEDAAKIGTGVVKGPIAGAGTRAAWKKNGADWMMNREVDPKPVYSRVDPWHFFPDPDATCIKDSDGVYERHLMKARDLRRLAREPGFDQDAIRRLLTGGTRGVVPQFFQDLRNITGENTATVGDVYVVWEYHGSLTSEDLLKVAIAARKPELIDTMEPDLDPLDEVPVILWFCENELLKVGIHPLDSGDCLYSVFNLEPDEASIFGFGVPYMMRHSQSVMNAAWRMMMDNLGVSAGPQIVYDDEQVEPVDGRIELAPYKIWRKKAGGTINDMKGVFQVYEIPARQEQLAAVIEMAMRFMDDETSMPMIAQGEEGAQGTQTLGGMSILMNSANVVFRRIVKGFDDHVTVPNITRIYHWLMQQSPKETIKGDYCVDARGSSVLLVREMQAQNLMNVANLFGAHPVFGPILKSPKLLRKLFQAMMLPADEVVLTDPEIEEAMRKAAEQPAEADPAMVLEREKMTLERAIAELKAETELEVARLRHEAEMAKTAEDRNKELDRQRMELQKNKDKIDSEERRFAVDLATAEQQGPSGGNF